MVGVEHNGAKMLSTVSDDPFESLHSVCGGNAPDVVSSSGGTGDGSFLVSILQSFSGEEGSTTLRDLQDDGGADIPSSLETGIDDG